MPISISCPSCNATLKLPDAAAGKKAKCPKCSAEFTVDAAAPAAPVETVQPEPSRAPEAPPRRPRRDDRDWDDDDVDRRIRRRDDDDGGISTLIPTKNPKALAAYYCGVFSIIPCLGLVLGPIALVLGILGLRYVKANPSAKGTGHSIAGIILGGLTTLANWGTVIFFVVGLAWSAYSSPKPTPGGPSPGPRLEFDKPMEIVQPKPLFAENADLINPMRKWEFAPEPGERAVIQVSNSEVFRVAFSPDGTHLAAATGDGNVEIWELANAKRQTLKKQATSISFSPDGKQLALGYEGPALVVAVYDWASGQPVQTVYNVKPTEGAQAVTYSPDGGTLAAITGETVRLWEVGSWREKPVYKTPGFRSTSLAFSPDGKTLAVPAPGNLVRLWDIDGGKEKGTLKGHDNFVTAVAFRSDGKHIASTSADTTVKIWDLDQNKVQFSSKAHGGGATCVAFSPNGKLLASGGRDSMIRLWDVATSAALGARKGHPHGNAINSLAFSPDGQTLVSASHGIIKAWDVDKMLGP
jgi:dipeptidyl aminopeptidase/acylaminoacyl peptidase